jgi:5-formyltetrahydrofolate cyclo-ligase
MTGSDDGDDAGFASPPCFMHEVDPLYAGLTPKSDAQQRKDVLRWRKSTRATLIERRLALESALRRDRAGLISHHLDGLVGDVSGRCVSIYWPFRGEPDLRDWLAATIARGATGALPVVAVPRAPMLFRRWQPGDALTPGIWNIPVPAQGAAILPDIVIAPLVGFDRAGFRLGYGGGYYDRTLAAMPQRPQVLGVGFALGELPTIYPLPHDIPMDAIVTEEGVACRPF